MAKLSISIVTMIKRCIDYGAYNSNLSTMLLLFQKHLLGSGQMKLLESIFFVPQNSRQKSRN